MTTHPNPSNFRVSFDTIAELTAATIPDGILRVFAAGLMFVPFTGTAAATTSNGGAKKWAPPLWDVTFKHFGAVGDGVTNDRAAIIAALAFCAEVAVDVPFDAADDGEFPGQIVLSGGGGVFAIDQQINLPANNSGILIKDTDFFALASGNWATAGGTPTSERLAYRPQKSDHMFNSQTNCTYVVFKNCRFNCNNQCGAVALRARGRFRDCWVKKCAGVGVRGLAGDVWVSGSIIGQWDQNDAAFFDKDAFTGIGVLCEDGESDMRVSGSVIRWLHECVRFDATNCNVWDCHIFNGAENYLAADRSAFSTDMKNALNAHFGASQDWDNWDFDARTYHAGVVTAGSSGLTTKDNSFSDIYFDNCHFEHYSDRVSYRDIRIAAKLANTNPSRGAPDYWWRFYCNQNGADPEFFVQVSQVLVETVTKKIVTLAAFGGNSWNVNYNPFETSRYNAGGSDGWADGFTMGKPYVHVNVETQTGFPAVTYHGPQTGSFVGFSDKDTTLDSTGDPVASRFGGRGVNPTARGLGGFIFETIDVDGSNNPTGTFTERFRATMHGCIRLPALSAEPTANNNEMAISDGTASTNGFGGSGAGLYLKLSGSWSKL